jgi:hypothetical protein
MTIRANPLFNNGKPTVFLMRQWAQRGALQPLRLVDYLDSDGNALLTFRAVWQAAFPGRAPLPREPLADRAGRGTDEFWNIFA